MNIIHEFLAEIFGDVPGVIVLWTRDDKKSRCFENTHAGRAGAAEYAVGKAEKTDVYFGLGLHSKAMPASSRGKANDVIGIGCIWADIDFGPGHKKPVAPDEATARRLVESIEPKPSMLIHSGGGLHAYWLLKEPWLFVDDADRERAKKIVPAWQNRLRAAFAREGYTLDSTGDLARVLRLPGTHNYKTGDLRPVLLIHPPEGILNGNLTRYNIADFESPVSLESATTKPVVNPVNINMGTREKRCRAYLQKCPDAVSGNGGHDATLRAACECFRFGLDDATALRVMQDFNQSKTAGEQWADDELTHKLDSAREKIEQDGEMGCRLSEADDAIPFKVRWKGHGFQCVVMFENLVETIDLGRTDPRARLVGKLVQAMPGVNPAEIEKQLLQLVDDRRKQLDANDQKEIESNQSISEVMVEIACEAELAHDESGQAFARFQVDSHIQTWPVKSRGFRLWLSKQLYDRHSKAACAESMKSALDLIEAKAIHDGRKVQVGVRVMKHNDAIYLDLCNGIWQVVQITTRGWKLLEKSPVWFRRSNGMLPLPVPVQGGTVDELKPFINFRDDGNFTLVVAWLLATLNPDGPFPALSVCNKIN